MQNIYKNIKCKIIFTAQFLSKFNLCQIIKLLIPVASKSHIHLTIVHTFVDAPTFAHYLFSVEQKKVTQGLRTLLSDDGGRYMASEKQVSNNLSNSVLKRISKKRCTDKKKSEYHAKMLFESNVATHTSGRLTCSGHGCSWEAGTVQSPPPPPRCIRSCL